jgi:hypothetical protein
MVGTAARVRITGAHETETAHVFSPQGHPTGRQSGMTAAGNVRHLSADGSHLLAGTAVPPGITASLHKELAHGGRELRSFGAGRQVAGITGEDQLLRVEPLRQPSD